ncbi:protein-L-isoaspartate(D-aspartate) O-methyltransferase [Filomicrobium insigne]|uniref:Protein-L-isoaspartate O-methyltransferase n=1 Tax=Filomicrobium insigne TaxID=418854 RepID=A0A1H0Q487_9HYPH|nr:protein-L-isoaspartate(D-aspartate) O-methyltransferase [Filomicrobium insigne]SDP11920.1 protein-L-isoaspartate(D-aspartate) O-methyltransferase [Filomicrobium insigne]
MSDQRHAPSQDKQSKTLDFSARRRAMVHNQIAARGVESEHVLKAMERVPREQFLPEHMQEFAYDDTPLPIEEGQTISQPYIVAFMTEALNLEGGEKVLEIGTGSGYAAAVLSEIASDVYTVERLGELAVTAAAKLSDLGYRNVHVLHADGTRGWPEHAPYDAIIVAAGGPEVPASLKRQLKIGGRLVIPIGTDPRAQELVRVTRVGDDAFESEDIADVRFVPLVGEEGWASGRAQSSPRQRTRRSADPDDSAISTVREFSEPFDSMEDADLDALIARIGDARVVLLGEATHGTSEFYRMRERLSQELILKKGFRFIAIEGDWPDAARVDHYVRHFEYPASEWTAFARFPTWMWRNREVQSFVDWLRDYNEAKQPEQRVAFHGLDLYSLYTSIRSVLAYLDDVDPEAAETARERYGCLTPWQSDPATYGRAALTGRFRSCEDPVARMLSSLLERRHAYALRDGDRYFDAVQNAKLVANAERYYRIMYYGSRASWNLRDRHMFETLTSLLEFYGANSKTIVWAHNSHVGDALATEMALRGEHNLGQLCRAEFGRGVYTIGFGTDHGQVAAASNWDGPMEVKTVRPAVSNSYERLFHKASQAGNSSRFLLNVAQNGKSDLYNVLGTPRLERAIGVIYSPETELASHYFQAVLPKQFDDYFWFDETSAITPLDTKELEGLPDTYPFGV